MVSFGRQRVTDKAEFAGTTSLFSGSADLQLCQTTILAHYYARQSPHYVYLFLLRCICKTLQPVY